ncbi:MAG: methylated-DNA--[protein]-cysteine S-methyltransferase [Promethearchaeota archaeon]
MSYRYACMPFPGMEGVKICVSESKKDGVLINIRFILKGVNDSQCADCAFIRNSERNLAAFKNIYLYNAIFHYLESGIMPEISINMKELIHEQFKTNFQRKIMETLLEISAGEKITYGELAFRAGYPGSARAVGNVMKKNPLPLLIPCHRVVSSRGIGGYCGGKDDKFIEIKRFLLEKEKDHTIKRDNVSLNEMGKSSVSIE